MSKKGKQKAKGAGSEKDGDSLRWEMSYDISKIRDYLNEDQTELLDNFRKSLSDEYIDEHAKRWLTDSTLCRFLRARQWDLDKSRAMLANCLKWRHEYQPYKITAEDVKLELENKGKMYRGSHDKYGRPILYMKPGKDNTGPEHRDVKVKYLVYLMEKCALAANKNNHEKLTLLMDFKDNNSAGGLAGLKTSREILAILQDYYPESLGSAFIYNHPWGFSLFWNVIYPFIDPITREKIHMVSKPEKFLEYIDEAELEVAYGGKNDFEYNFEKHWKKEDEEFPIWNPEKEKEEAALTKAKSDKRKQRKKKKKSAAEAKEDAKKEAVDNDNNSETESDEKAPKKTESHKHRSKKT